MFNIILHVATRELNLEKIDVHFSRFLVESGATKTKLATTRRCFRRCLRQPDGARRWKSRCRAHMGCGASTGPNYQPSPGEDSPNLWAIRKRLRLRFQTGLQLQRHATSATERADRSGATLKKRFTKALGW
eukprot:SAG11_NODE_1052_length_6029_cov_4.823946_2_plen_131_part_00